MKQKISYLVALVFLINLQTIAKEYHVSIKGNNDNPGTLSEPFGTISAAAKIALAGDIITVHEGTYREWVNPQYGGSNDQQRIVYRAAEKEKVWIKGSEVVNTWRNYKNNVWKVTLNNSMFDDFNPYREIV